MKLFKLSLLLVLVSFFTACSDDDDDSNSKNCVQSDWIGTYTGTQNCNGDLIDIVVEVTASGSDNLVISTFTDDVDIEYDPIPYNNCDLSQSSTEQGLTLSIEASVNGNVITLNESISASGSSSTCVTTATK